MLLTSIVMLNNILLNRILLLLNSILIFSGHLDESYLGVVE